MEKLYYIDTENAHGQFLIFETLEGARNWMKRATWLNDEQIESRIFCTSKNWQGHFDIWPRRVIEIDG